MRVVLLDYRKAFDLVDHGTLAAKILLLRIPSGLARWVCDFLKDRRKQVKLSSYCFSECGRQRGREGGREGGIPSGVPQGTNSDSGSSS